VGDEHPGLAHAPRVVADNGRFFGADGGGALADGGGANVGDGASSMRSAGIRAERTTRRIIS
jgi:hypothetical protein